MTRKQLMIALTFATAAAVATPMILFAVKLLATLNTLAN
jgi:hypothetical protein